MPEKDALEQDLSFGYLVSILGFGLCRVWIVFCLSIPLNNGQFTGSWVFLLAGALAALASPVLAGYLRRACSHPRLALLRLTAGILLLGSLLIPGALWTNSGVLLALGRVIGGLGAGLLQVLWGERFAIHPPRFSLTVAPAAAILTALVVALSLGQVTLIALFICPLVSFVLLVLEVDGPDFCRQLFGRRFLATATTKGKTKNPATNALPTAAMSDGTPPGAIVIDSNPADNSVGSIRGKCHLLPRAQGFDSAVWKLMFSILLFSFICRSLDSLPLVDTDPFTVFGGSVLFALILVGVSFLVLAALLKERFNVALTYRLSLPLMTAGFAALALFINIHTATSLLLINMGYEFFDLLSWILFADIARRQKGKALPVFGLGVAFTFLGMALGYFCGDTLAQLLLNGATQATGVALLCIVALVLVAFLVIPEGTVTHLASSLFTEPRAAELAEDKDEAKVHGGVNWDEADRREGEVDVARDGMFSPASATNPPPAPEPLSLQQACARVAAEHRLTAREGEVLLLLARGRTLAIIARELNIAQGTVRTDIERVYTKLGVHKQQELIDLIEATQIPPATPDSHSARRFGRRP